MCKCVFSRHLGTDFVISFDLKYNNSAEYWYSLCGGCHVVLISTGGDTKGRLFLILTIKTKFFFLYKTCIYFLV